MNNKLFRKFNRIVIVFILFLLLFPFAENPVFSSNWPNNDESLLAGPIKEVMPIGDKVVYYGENGKTKEDLGLPAQVDIMLEDGSTLSGVDVDWDNGTPQYDRYAIGTYTFTGTLVNLPESVTNPEGLKAVVNVTVLPTTTGWEFTSDEEGWKSSKLIKNFGWNSGSGDNLGVIRGDFVSSAARQASIETPDNLDVPIGNIRYVKIMMKNDTTFNEAVFYYYVKYENGEVSPEYAVVFDIIPNSDYTEYIVDLKGLEDWEPGNRIKILYIDPVNGITDGSFCIDYVRLEPEVYKITASAEEHGSISPEGVVDVIDGGSRTFTFQPDEGYEVDKVIVDGEEIDVVGNSYTFEDVNSNHSISVSFKAVEEPVKTYTITAVAGEHGSIDPEGEVVVEEGGSQTFTFEADEGYEIDKVIVDGEEIEVVGNSYTFENVTDNHSISVSFKAVENPPVIIYPPVITLPAEEPKVVDGKIEFPVPVVKEGVAATEITADIFKKALESAQKDTAGVKTVIINIPEATGAQEYRQILPRTVLTSDTADTKVEIVTDIAKLEVQSNMLTSTDMQADTISLSIARVDADELEPEIARQIGDRPVVKLTLTVGNKTVEWNNPDAPVTVTIPYTPTAEELKDPEHIVVWYIDGSGNIVTIPNGRYNPENGTVTFTTTHFSNYAVAYVHKTFTDLGSSPWAKKAIEVMASKGIISGKGNDIFSPTENITRADYLMLLIKTLGLTADFEDNFDDVERNAYYYEAVGIAKKLNIAAGSGNNMFNPNENISRQDMIVLTARALKKFKDLDASGALTVLDKFSDKGDISEYALESMAEMVGEGLIEGSGDRVYPLNNTTRAEAAVFLYRIYNRIYK